MNRVISSVVLCVSLAVTGCNSDSDDSNGEVTDNRATQPSNNDGEPASGIPSITDAVWHVELVAGDEENAAVDAMLKFGVFTEDAVEGRLACNSLSGSYQVDNETGEIGFENLSWTEMGCYSDSSRYDVEAELIAMISEATRFRIEGDKLELESSLGVLTLNDILGDVKDKREELGADIDTLLDGAKGCDSDSQCKTLAFGAKPCGGPWEYLVYSERDVDEALLIQTAEEYNRVDEEYAQLTIAISTCDEAIEPVLACIDSVCTETDANSPTGL
ncbi:MAG: hypothetical protein CMF25_03925 [Kangiellaceae bacterium]|nr:hypothetical protein [Kangiellaceae bacterium]|tara:strand:+ start:1056 stop:1877 length:822 start_codon:yes stop_codon:yes gene_type:complete